MPERFQFPTERTALWLPAGIDAAKTESATFDFQAIARLRDGATVEAAAADLQQLLPHVPEVFPGRLTTAAIEAIRMQAVVRPLRDTMVGEVGRTLWVVLGAAAFLLLIACANVANLFLVRAEERQHELAVRRALGAGRGAIVAEFLSEGLILAGFGGVLGLGLAAVGVRLLRSLEAGVNIPRLAGVGLDGSVLAVATSITVLAALIMSVVPALRYGGTDVSMVVVRAGRAATAGHGRHRARRAFVVLQIALGLVLVAGAGLMARSFASLRSVLPGFVAAQSWTFRIALPDGAYPTTGDAASLVLRVLDAVAALPGVQAVGAVSKLPLDDEARRDTAVFVENRQLGMGVMPNIHQVVYATPGTFAALGTPLVQGRTFERPDPARAPLEVIVTRALAERYWGDSTAVGRRLRLAPRGPLFTIVGVTGDIRGTRLEQPPDETVYLPLVTAPGRAAADGGAGAARWLPREVAMVVRGAGDQATAAAAVERTLRALAPTVPVYGERPMAAVVSRATARTTFTLQLLGIASIAALVLAAVGLYGVVSYMVSLRAREMAVRIALGAQPGALRRLVLRQAVAVAAFGIALGVGASLLLMRFLASLLFAVAPNDPAALFGAVALMAGVTVVAGWVPARRAAALDPAAVLRAE
jgi:predicted permease